MAARDRGPDEAPTAAAVSQLIALATALKQSTIYPAGHPRVRQGVAEFLQPLARAGSDCTLALRADTFRIGDAHVAIDHVATRWLADRLREAGLRGIELTPACSVDDVLELAQLFREARRGRARVWPADHPRLRALPLVFDGTHEEGARPAPPENEPPPFASLPPRVGAALARIRSSESFQQRLREIQRAALAAGAPGQRDVDLLETIGGLIPEHVAERPERVIEMVERVLDTFAQEIAEVAPRPDAMKGMQLLQRVVAVARRYFPARGVVEATVLPPAGRPEDEAIGADVDALLRELSALTADARSVARDVATATGRALAHELLGVHLHAFATARSPSLAAAAPLLELLRKHAAERPSLLDPYLARENAGRSLPSERRVLLLAMLVETGHAALVHTRGYVDEAVVVRDFPESLPLAARLLGTDPAGLALLRRALASVAPTLMADGIPAAIAIGVLRDPVVLRALLTAGGDEARELLLAAADAEPRLTRTAILAHLRTRALPDLAALVLRTYRSDESLTPKYVRSLWLACDHQRADPQVDAASAELLATALAAGTPMAHADRITALPYLHLATRGRVEELLRRFATEGRFTRWGREAQELRTQARRALALLRTTRTR